MQMQRRKIVEINKELLFPFLIYNKPLCYNENITLYPITMDNYLIFKKLSQSIIVRKNSIFREKKIIKMTYLDFLQYCYENIDLEKSYGIPNLSGYFVYAIQLLQLCCKDAEIKINQQTFQFMINNEIITPQIFDDLRRIIIIQNDIDFDIDEFINYDTEQRLLKAEQDQNKDGDKIDIEDYIDSMVVALNTTEDRIMNMTIRKFMRYLKRYQLHENYTIYKTGECSGMVSFKEPIKHWMVSLDEDDKYKNLKTDEETLKSKVG